MFKITAMKQLCLLCLILACFPITIIPQSCLPEGIEFTTQAQIDSFQVNYPNCTEIQGSVLIIDFYNNVTNLNGLSSLTSIGENLQIGVIDALGNPALVTLTGLEGLTYIGVDLIIQYNSALNSFIGLNNLTTIGGSLVIETNPSLPNLAGFNNMSTIGSDIVIMGNDSMTSLTGLSSLTVIGNSLGIGTNNSLTSLTGLESLTSIGGSLFISNNATLINLTGIDNIDAVSINGLSIKNNPSLSTCDVQSICDYLASPNGTINIQNNAPGCNSQEEVEYACGVGLAEILEGKDCIVFPNPSHDLFTINFTLDHSTPVRLEVINRFGKVVDVILNGNIPQGEHQVAWNAEGMPTGVYFYRFATNDRSSTGKLVITR